MLLSNYDYDYLIVGAGLYGAVFAHEISKYGKKCLVIDKRQHLGGNIYCDNINGINVHKYGPHIFHTDKNHIWEYVNKFIKFNSFVYSPIANFKGKLYSLPFNMNTFYQLWGVTTPIEAMEKINKERKAYSNILNPKNLEEQTLSLCGKDIYEKLVKGYTEKQWGKPATELPAFIIRRLPFRFAFNNNYFDDPFQGIPIGGYNILIDKLLDGIETRVNTNYFLNRVFWENKAKKILFTGPLDEFFNYRFGRLEYRSLRFETKELESSNYQGNAAINYTDKYIPFTRVIEHKHFEYGIQPSTVVTWEFPEEYSNKKEPYYPVNSSVNNIIFQKYIEYSKTQKRYLFGGRLGSYKYYDMDDTIEAAILDSKKEINI